MVQEKKQKRGSRAEARNAVEVQNASVDFQKIKTAEIEIPVIAADVLVYEPGELGSSYPDRTRLYYSPEALSDPEYLQTVLRSPLVVGSHEKSTTEFNRDVDGWPLSAIWDDREQRVKVRGVLHGEENVAYAEANKGKPSFGTSAYISFLEIDRTPGTSPDGKPYDAVVRKAVNNHIAILPNIRDPKNIILAMNAVVKNNEEGANATNADDPEQLHKWIKELSAAHPDWEQDQVVAVAYKKIGEGENMATNDANTRARFDRADEAYHEELKKLGIRGTISQLGEDRKGAPGSRLRKLYDEVVAAARADGGHFGYNSEEESKNSNDEDKKKMEYEEFKGHMNAYEKEKGAEDEMVEKVANAVIAKMNAKNEEGEKKPEEKKEEAKDAKNEEEKKDDGGEASNALPSEAMVKDFADGLGVTFKTVPSFKELATLAGVTAATPGELIAALNAKRATFAKPEAMNTRESADSVAAVLATL